LPQFINNFLISTLQDVICTVGLVGGDEVTVEGSWERHDGFQFILQLADEVGLEDSRTLASIIEVRLGDVPAADHEFTGVHHGDDFFHWFVHVTEGAALLVVLEAHVSSRGLSEGAVEVGVSNSVLCLPRKFVLVGEDACNQGRAIVAAKADEHDAELGNFLSCGDGVLSHNVLVRFLALIKDSKSLAEFSLNVVSAVVAVAASSLYIDKE
jgi:hypothetical protein